MAAKPDSKNKTGFTPGAFKVHTPVSGMKNPSIMGTFVHADSAVDSMAGVLVDTLYEVHAGINNEPLERDEFGVLIKRMCHLYMAKQLSTAVGPKDASLTQSNMGVVSSEIKFPTALVPFLGGYGFIEDKDGDWELVGQALWSTTYMARALCTQTPVVGGHAQAAWDRTRVFANKAHHNWRQEIIDGYKPVVELWGRTSVPTRILVNNVGIECAPPVFQRGAAAYAAFVAPWNPPVAVLRALRVLAIMEGLGAGEPGAAVVQALNADDVFIVDWNRETVAGLVSNYRSDVEARLLRSMMSVWHVDTIKATSKSGALWQLYDRSGQELMGPKAMVGEQEQTGWAMSMNGVMVNPSPKAWMIHYGSTHQDKLRNSVQAFTKF